MQKGRLLTRRFPRHHAKHTAGQAMGVRARLALVLLAAVACQAFVPSGPLGGRSGDAVRTPARAAAPTMAVDGPGAAKRVIGALTDVVIKGAMVSTAILGGSLAGGAGLLLSSSPPLAPQPAVAAVVNLPRCEGGQGEGCAAMSEGSEFVRKLQERSAQNYDARRKQYLINYNYNNFKDYFAFKGQVLVIRPDGRFLAIDKKVYDQLSKEGKVDGNKWLSNEDPPSGFTDFIPSKTDNVPMPVME